MYANVAVLGLGIMGSAMARDAARAGMNVSLASSGRLVPPWAIAKLKKIADRRTAETEFPLRWAHKDVRLALAAAGEDKSHLPVLNQIAATRADALPDFGADDLSAIYLALRQQHATSGN
jgi:3-hydroxyisobutyrate dehydrogenase